MGHGLTVSPADLAHDGARHVSLQDFYTDYDRDDTYERLYGYVNPVAAAYWCLRDELIVESVTTRFDTLNKPMRVLEVGSGYGHELAKFAHLGIPQSHLTGIDLVSHRVDRAKSIYPCISFSQQDAAHLAFPDNTFDIVCQFLCVVQALSKDLQHAICRELVRVLKPGGIVIWFDVAPQRWRLVLLWRLCNLLSASGDKSLRQVLRDLLNDVWRTLCETVSPSRRRDVVTKSSPPYLLPMARDDVVRMFHGLKVHAVNAGLDYACWDVLWRRSRSLAQALWRAGWFSNHCFAVIEKERN